MKGGGNEDDPLAKFNLRIGGNEWKPFDMHKGG